ncbi:hypothetical protein LTR56_021709 [Elasticomyces elasticus]|nr:hypothetical protein LTR56_021709 [Elasticomyces elasticus]KAK3630611.1 hypothetical protein LTR22_021413 [Elasticomyces elasticus]KAK4909141.1 hypothetical protein LTR49_022040 [Elasticomyces elasticus]KAK5749223.1 hypothetical protein LTS12_020734 [Elasticomyces elasticus]
MACGISMKNSPLEILTATSTPTMRPTIQVLNSPKLLESILLNLPMRDLLFALKVCKKFKQVIDTSRNIQQALFFIPASYAAMRDRPEADIDGLTCRVWRKTVLRNPLVAGTNKSSPWVRNACIQFDRALLDVGSKASCLRMYLSQPPVEVACDGGSFFFPSFDDGGRGRTFGEMQSWFSEIMDDNEECGRDLT